MLPVRGGGTSMQSPGRFTCALPRQPINNQLVKDKEVNSQSQTTKGTEYESCTIRKSRDDSAANSATDDVTCFDK